MRRLVFMLFFVALLCLIAYNSWQVRALRVEVAGLTKEVAALKRGDVSVSSTPADRSLIAKASKHLNQAKKHIADGDFGRAKGELEKSLQLMQRFSQESGESAKDAVDKLRGMWREAGATIERLRHAVGKESEKGKAEGG